MAMTRSGVAADVLICARIGSAAASIKDIKEPFDDINNNVRKAIDQSTQPVHEPAPQTDKEADEKKTDKEE